MANSIIDDMLKEQIPNENPKKKSSKIFILFILLIIIVIVIAGIFAIMYWKKKNEIKPKLAFLEYLGKSNLTTILDFETYNDLNQKIIENNSEISSDISFLIDSPFVNMENVNLKLNANKDIKNQKSYSEATLNYANFDILALKMLTSSDSVAIKSDEIVSKYVGSKYKNLNRVLQNIITDEDLKNVLEGIENNDLAKSNFIYPTIPQGIFNKYINIIAENADETSFSEKKVTLKKENRRY